jgi:hypothetical protein
MSFLIDYNEEKNIYDNFSQLKSDTSYEMKKDSFNDALRATKSKFNEFCKINDNNQNSNLIENIKNKNIHMKYIFKKNNLNKVDDIINDEAIIDELCKNISNKKYNKSVSYIDNNKEETKDTDKKNWIDHENKNDYKDYFDMKMNNYSTIDNTNYNYEKVENIDEFVKIKNNSNNNHDLFNQNTNKNLLCKKRNNDCSYIKIANNLIEEILNLYKDYNTGKKDQKNEEYRIYEDGILKKNITIIENNQPICAIYIEKKVINDIYLIKEKILTSNEDEIMEILNKIKKNIEKKLK